MENLSETENSIAPDHSKLACSEVSGVDKQRSQMGSVIIILHTRFPLVGKEFLQALHIRFFVLLGEFKAQIPFHKSVSWSGGSVWTSGDSSSFKNLYPICKYGPHLETKTRIEYHQLLS